MLLTSCVRIVFFNGKSKGSIKHPLNVKKTHVCILLAFYSKLSDKNVRKLYIYEQVASLEIGELIMISSHMHCIM